MKENSFTTADGGVVGQLRVGGARENVEFNNLITSFVTEHARSGHWSVRDGRGEWLGQVCHRVH
jgi:hypothetical protein